MKALRFLYDFLVGDDWQVACAVVLGMVLTWVVARHDSHAWLVIPVVLLLALPWSLWRATRR